MGIKVEKKVLAINGSPRKNGNSDSLLNHFIKELNINHIENNSISLRDYNFKGCIGCERCRKDEICTGIKDDMNSFYPDILTSQALVLVCPTHNYNITAWMKAFIDRLYCFYKFENPRPGKWSSALANPNRKAIVIAICEQENEEDMGYTAEAMYKPLEALGYEICDVIKILKCFERGKVNQDELILKRIKEAANALSKSLN
ncbi:MAG: flavodoxin family protein [Sphaerochaetaceae bacterium]|nr:flavodoxin family protein [Sphaerochaetaceae bacterium]